MTEKVCRICLYARGGYLLRCRLISLMVGVICRAARVLKHAGLRFLTALNGDGDFGFLIGNNLAIHLAVRSEQRLHAVPKRALAPIAVFHLSFDAVIHSVQPPYGLFLFLYILIIAL